MKPRVAAVAGLCRVFPDDWIYVAVSDRPTHTFKISYYFFFSFLEVVRCYTFSIFPCRTAELN